MTNKTKNNTKKQKQTTKQNKKFEKQEKQKILFCIQQKKVSHTWLWTILLTSKKDYLVWWSLPAKFGWSQTSINQPVFSAFNIEKKKKNTRLKFNTLFNNFLCFQGHADSRLCLKQSKNKKNVSSAARWTTGLGFYGKASIQFHLLFTFSGRKGYIHFGLRTETKFIHPPPTMPSPTSQLLTDPIPSRSSLCIFL